MTKFRFLIPASKRGSNSSASTWHYTLNIAITVNFLPHIPRITIQINREMDVLNSYGDGGRYTRHLNSVDCKAPLIARDYHGMHA